MQLQVAHERQSVAQAEYSLHLQLLEDVVEEEVDHGEGDVVAVGDVGITGHYDLGEVGLEEVLVG